MPHPPRRGHSSLTGLTWVVTLPAPSTPPPEMVAQVNGVYLTGVAHHDDHLLVLLDLSRVLTVEEAAEVSALQSKVEG